MARVRMCAHCTMVALSAVVLSAAVIAVAHEASSAIYSVSTLVVHR
jgi:hypothetical protein